MNRQKLEKYILDTYGVSPEYPWIKYPTFAVFRHESNRKCFAVIITINKRKLGILKTLGLGLKIGTELCFQYAQFDFTVEEMDGRYPEYYCLGTAPAYGFYIRHADNFTEENNVFYIDEKDIREKIVLDDVNNFM